MLHGSFNLKMGIGECLYFGSLRTEDLFFYTCFGHGKLGISFLQCNLGHLNLGAKLVSYQ